MMKRILVVDDEKELAEIVAEQLSHAGYQTGLAYDGVEAVLSVMDYHWDIVLMDVRMPKLDGINALRIMRKIAPDVAVFIISGQSGKSEVAEAIKLGAYSWISKPIRLDEVLKSIALAPERNY